MDYKAELNKAVKRQKDIERALNESSVVVFTNDQGIIEYANEKCSELSHYRQDELIGASQTIVSSGYHDQAFFDDMWATIRAGHVWRGQIKNKTKDGDYYWVDVTTVPFLDEDNKPYQYVSIRHDITKLKEYEERIKRMAYYDPLTHLPNTNWLGEWLKQRDNKRGKHFTVLFIDIDCFKSINDTFGQRTGDRVLRGLTERLKGCLSSSDIAIRQGADEFIILLNYVDKKEEVMPVLDKMNELMQLPFDVGNEQITVTISIGVSAGKLNDDSTDHDILEKIIRQADIAMFYAKKRGGNRTFFNTKTQNKEMDRYYQIEQALKQALDNHEFYLVYQPLVDLADNQISGVEVLLRWHHQKLGQVTPDEFIPLLEETGEIIIVGNWVLAEACKQMVQWHKQGFNMKRIAVNVSPIQFNNRNFIHDVKRILHGTSINPHVLELEITEGAIIDVERSEMTLHELRQLGIAISIDDFGTGYSSLSYLKKLPINTLKIDKSFIDTLDHDGEVIVSTIIHMGKNLNFRVLAEGIEREEQLSYLKSLHCNEGQGYFWSKPVSATQLEKLV